MDTSEILAIASVISAIGTLTLAYFTYKTIKASEAQLNFLRAQTKLFTKQQEPLITIQDRKFKGNTIELLLKNCSNGIAYEVAVKMRYYITKQELDDESKRLLMTTSPEKRHTLQLMGYDKLKHEQVFRIRSEVLSIEDEDLKDDLFLLMQPWFIKSRLRKTGYYNVYPHPTVTFMFSKSSNQSLLEPKTEGEWFEVEPFFMISLSKKHQSFAPTKANTFDELIGYFKENNINTFGITFSLGSRDRVGRVIHHEEIDSCIVDLREHNTIEDAIKGGRKVHFTPLGWREIQKRVKWMSASDYESIQFERE